MQEHHKFVGYIKDFQKSEKPPAPKVMPITESSETPQYNNFLVNTPIYSPRSPSAHGYYCPWDSVEEMPGQKLLDIVNR